MKMTEDKLFSGMGENSKSGRWEKSWTENNITKEICVKEAENGYVITLKKYGEFPKGDGDETSYRHFEKQLISKTNPLAKKKESLEDKQKSMLEALDIGPDVEFENI